MASGGTATIKIRADPSELYEAINNLPDEVLDRLAREVLDRLARKVAERLARRERLTGRTEGS